jgi:hypothetical protein
MSNWTEVERRFLVNAKRLRKAKRRTGSWMARQGNWSRTTQSRFDKGLGSIRLIDALSMAAALGVDPIVLCHQLTDEQIEWLSGRLPPQHQVLWKVMRGYGDGPEVLLVGGPRDGDSVTCRIDLLPDGFDVADSVNTPHTVSHGGKYVKRRYQLKDGCESELLVWSAKGADDE